MNEAAHQLNSLAAGWVLVLAALTLNACAWLDGGPATGAFLLGVILAALSIFVAHMCSGMIAQGDGPPSSWYWLATTFCLASWFAFIAAALYREF